MEKMILTTKGGQEHMVNMHVIDEENLHTYLATTNCVLIYAKKEGSEFVLIRKVDFDGEHQRAGVDFKAWDRINGGIPEHMARAAGATHWGLIHCASEGLSARLKADLPPDILGR